MSKKPRPARASAPLPTSGQKGQRVNEVMRLLMEGKTRGFVLQHSAETWGLSTRRTDALIHAANGQMQAIFRGQASTMLARIAGQMQWHIQKLSEKDHHYQAVLALGKLAEICGVTKFAVELSCPGGAGVIKSEDERELVARTKRALGLLEMVPEGAPLPSMASSESSPDVEFILPRMELREPSIVPDLQP